MVERAAGGNKDGGITVMFNSSKRETHHPGKNFKQVLSSNVFSNAENSCSCGASVHILDSQPHSVCCILADPFPTSSQEICVAVDPCPTQSRVCN
jgi:hypothetical protein